MGEGFWFCTRVTCKGISFCIPMVCGVVSLIWPESMKPGWTYEPWMSIGMGFAVLLVIAVLVIRHCKEGLHSQKQNAQMGEVKGNLKRSPGERQIVPTFDRVEDQFLSLEQFTMTRENVPVKWSHPARVQAHNASDSRNAILCLLLTLANMVRSVAASPAMAGVAAQTSQKQNETCWAAIVSIAMAIAGVALAIVSASWLWIRVPDLEAQQLHQGQAILDITQAFQTNILLPNIPRINTRIFEDTLLPEIIPE